MHAHTSITYCHGVTPVIISITNWLSTIRPTPLQWLPVLSHCRQTYSLQTLSIISKENLMFLFTRTSSTIQCLVCHPASKHGPSTRLLPQKTSGELLGRLMIFQLTPRSSMTHPTVPVPGANLPRREWCIVNHFRSGAGRCAASLHQTTALCVCGATLSSLTAA